MIRRTSLVIALLASLGCLRAQAQSVPEDNTPKLPPVVNVPPKATIEFKDDQAMPPAVLDALDRQELGKLYTPEIAPKLPVLHQLIEKYFSASGDARKQVIPQISSLNIDPNTIGRLMRIRLYWPQLEPGVYYVNEKIGPHSVIYFFGVPRGYDRAKSWPLVIKLPGEQPFIPAENHPAPTAEQVAFYFTSWIKQELAEHPDAIVLMPLLNVREQWGPTYAGLNNVMQPLLHAFGHLNVDPARVYIYGYGSAAHGAWFAALHYPTCYAGIGVFSTATSAKWVSLRLPNLHNIFTAIWHDPTDMDIPVAASQELFKELKQHKCPVDYEESPAPGHLPAPDTFSRVYAKMRSHTRELYPREVAMASNRPESFFNRNDWMQVYQMLTPGSTSKVHLFWGLIVPRGGKLPDKIVDSGTTEGLRLQENKYTLIATLAAPNRIEVASSNVESMRVYLNDQMLDLSKPVTLVVNGKQRWQGIPAVSLETMLADQSALGRGWRYFTAYVDFEFKDSDYVDLPATRRGKIEYTPIRKD